MRILRTLLIYLSLLLLISLLAIAGLIYASLENTALVHDADASANDANQYPALNSNEPGPSGLISISDIQLGKVIRELLQEKRIPAKVKIAFAPDNVEAYATLRLPIDTERKFLNVHVVGKTTSAPEHLRIESLQTGAISVPNTVINLARDYALTRCKSDRRCRAGLDTYRNIESIDLRTGVLKVRYTLGADTFRLLGKTDIDDLPVQLYQQALEKLATSRAGKNVELHEALQMVMRVASDRSKVNDPVKENAAALMAIAMLNADRQVQEILIQSNKADWPSSELKLKVHNRRDLAQHFVNSAALFLIGGTEFSDYVGIYKEVYDVSSGKEFGTGDLIADRAGVRFAQRATRSHRLALELQQLMLNNNDSSGYLLSKAEIKRFEKEHSVNATDQIGAIVTVIDKALRKLPLLH